MIKKVLLYLFVVYLLCGFDFAKAGRVIHIDSIKKEISLDTLWRFHEGDNIQWANNAFDDKDWIELNSNLSTKGALDHFKGIGWFRIHLKVAPALFKKTMLLRLSQFGASEVYFNGKRVFEFGTVSASGNEVPYTPKSKPCFIELGQDTNQVIAIRYSAFKALQRKTTAPGFSMKLISTENFIQAEQQEETTIDFTAVIFGMFFTLALFHLLLFFFHRKIKSNLYYSIMVFLLSFFWLYPAIIAKSTNPFTTDELNNIFVYVYAPFFFFIVLVIYSIFDLKFSIATWVVLAVVVISEVFIAFGLPHTEDILMGSIIFSSVHSFRRAVGAVIKKKPGAWIIATGFGLFMIVVVAILVYVIIILITAKSASLNITDSNPLMFMVIMVWVFSIPTSMSVYLASNFARTNKSLALQLVHVKQLAEQNIQKEKEKQQIIEGQKETLQKQVKEKTAEIQEQKDELEEKNKEITDSITYARRIQTAILPSDEMLTEALGDHFEIYKPKDVVSGDFYWCYINGNNAVFAVADCTGHGVPGSLMSMIGNSILNEVVQDKKALEADLILNELRSTLISTLQKSSGTTTRDGMDIALCVWNKQNNTLQYAGANNSLYWLSENVASDGSIKESEKIKLYNKHLLEIIADKQPIGYQEGKMDVPFTKHIIQLRKGDSIFITSDGYTDQFGGEKNKKFTSKRFRDLLDTFISKPTSEQKLILEKTIEDWKRFETQTDDICLIGVRI